MAPARESRVKSRFQPERDMGRAAPHRFGEFASDAVLQVVDAPQRKRCVSTGAARPIEEEVDDQLLLPVRELQHDFGMGLPPGLDTSYPGTYDDSPKNLAFGRLEDGTYSGFYNENSQVFRCGADTAYWAVLENFPATTQTSTTNGNRRSRRGRAQQKGPFWCPVTLHECRVSGQLCTRMDPDCIVTFWCNGTMEKFYDLPRSARQVDHALLRPDIWSYLDGWNGILCASAIRYPVSATPLRPGLILASPEQVVMKGVNLLCRGFPKKIDEFRRLDAEATSFAELVTPKGVVLDPPPLSCLVSELHLPLHGGMPSLSPVLKLLVLAAGILLTLLTRLTRLTHPALMLTLITMLLLRTLILQLISFALTHQVLTTRQLATSQGLAYCSQESTYM